MEKCVDFLIKRDELKPGDHMYLELGYHIDSWRSAYLYAHHGLSSSSPSTYLEELQISSPSPPDRKQSPGNERMERSTPKRAIRCPLPSSVKQSPGKERMEERTPKGDISCHLPSSFSLSSPHDRKQSLGKDYLYAHHGLSSSSPSTYFEESQISSPSPPDRKQSPGKERMEGRTPKGAICCPLPSSVSPPSPPDRKQSLGKERMERRTVKVGAISCPLPSSVSPPSPPDRKQSLGKERMERRTVKVGAISCPLPSSVSSPSPLDRKQSLGKERMEGRTVKVGAINCPLPSSVKQSPGKERTEGSPDRKQSPGKERMEGCPDRKQSPGKERMEGSPDRKQSPGKERTEGSPDRKQSPGKERMEGSPDRKQSPGKERTEGSPDRKQSPGKERMEGSPDRKQSPGKERTADRKQSPGKERMEGSPDRKQSPAKERMEKRDFFNKIKRDELKPGDHIYSWRYAYLYAHHGIYMEDGKVIHFTNADTDSFSSCPSKLRNLCETCGDQSRSHGVIISCLDCFLSGGDLYLFRYSVSPFFFIAQVRGGTCTRAPSDPCDEVLHRARYLLDHKGFGIYNPFRNNCEDFAIYCKTGLLVEASSGQASALTAAKAAVRARAAIASSPLRFLTATTLGLIVVVGSVYCVSRYVSDIGFRRDTIKISVENLVAKMRTDEPEQRRAS